MSDNISPENIQKFKQVYANVNDIVLYIGGLYETPLEDAISGATFACINAYQFYLLKHSDRFWYESRANKRTSFTHEQLKEIKRRSFSSILCETLFGQEKMTKNTFEVYDEQTNPFVDCMNLPRMKMDLWNENGFEGGENDYESTTHKPDVEEPEDTTKKPRKPYKNRPHSPKSESESSLDKFYKKYKDVFEKYE